MRKTYGKNAFRTVKATLGRFAAIFAIVALGVGFLVGLLSAMPDTSYSFDKYFDESSMYDIRVMGDLGLSDADIAKLNELEGVGTVQAGYVADVLMSSSDDTEFTVRMHSLDVKNGNTLNIPELTSGRLPQNSSECVLINIPFDSKAKFQLGETLAVSEANENTDDILSSKEYTVVGFADYCPYFSSEKEYTNIGSGTVDLFLLAPNESFATDFYTDVYISVEGANALTSLTNQYQAFVDKTAARVDAIAGGRCQLRYDEVISQSTKEIAAAKANYSNANSEATAEASFADGTQEISDAEKALSEISVPSWYVYTRADNVSYSAIEANIDKVNAIAKIFPFFFFLVAVLVALTTMTRMVEDERLQIGTMKALGYSRGAIMGKYILYALTASFLGSAVGVAVGFKLLPTVIWNAFTMSFELSAFYSPINWVLAAVTSGALILCTLLATVNACLSTLKEKPAQLMLAKTPEAGKRVLLEKIPFIWNRLKFSYKITARNLFRYKKRFLMTSIGVAGCTALLVAGFGIRDSFSNIAERQFKLLTTYEILALVPDEADFENTELNNVLSNADNIADSTSVSYSSVTAENGENSIDIYTFVPEKSSDLEGFITFRNRESGKSIEFSDSSVIITEKASELLKVNVGDTLTITDNDDNTGSFTVTGICENYIQNYIYMCDKTYETGMGLSSEPNTLIVRLTENGLASKTDIGKALLDTEAVSGVSYTSDLRGMVDRALAKMDVIVVVIVLSAGALALVVLYNLTNINISERVKEIATLKVLGFTDREVNSYINRESLILSMIGTIIGLVLGFFLHRYIMLSAEMPGMMFGRSIQAISFVYSAALTLVFTVLVDLFMRRKLRNVNMVESMKAPE